MPSRGVDLNTAHSVRPVFALASLRRQFHAGPLPGEPVDATFANVADARVHYVERGAGQAVVLMHGFGSSLEVWQELVPELTPGHRVIAVDLKGFGWTDRPESDYSPAAQAEIVWALLDHLKVRRAALVGHSWGASVALAMALSAPKRTTRIALYAAWAYEEQLSYSFRWARIDGVGESLMGLYDPALIRSQMATAFFDSSYVTARRVKSVQTAMALPGAGAAALATMRGMRFAVQQARYSSIRVPALVLWGQQDRISTPAFGQRLAADLAANLIMFPRCGHFPMLEAQEASTSALACFLRSESGNCTCGQPGLRWRLWWAALFRRLVATLWPRRLRPNRRHVLRGKWSIVARRRDS